MRNKSFLKPFFLEVIKISQFKKNDPRLDERVEAQFNYKKTAIPFASLNF